MTELTVSQLRFDIPSYDQAMYDLMENITLGFVTSDNFLAQVPVRRTLHSGPTRSVREPQPLDQSLGALEHIMNIPFDVIRNSDINAFIQILNELGQSYIQQMGTSLFQTIDAVTEAIGNNVSAQGQPLSFDMIIDAVERIELRADDYGCLHPPTIYANREMLQRIAALQPTQEQLQRYTTIMQRKQEEYNAEKRTRRLSR